MRNIHYISAGAGSGKTHTLTEILADHIASGFCRPGEVLLTTFTEAAASEFREKTRRKLLERDLWMRRLRWPEHGSERSTRWPNH